ncbi:MAG: hypothetical protein IJR21_01590 [Synergistaceae bacterium]|nr:hypothetical protein [Synergistaceae bacterium]
MKYGRPSFANGINIKNHKTGWPSYDVTFKSEDKLLSRAMSQAWASSRQHSCVNTNNKLIKAIAAINKIILILSCATGGGGY